MYILSIYRVNPTHREESFVADEEEIPLDDRDPRDVYINMYVCIGIYIYIYLYLSIYLCI